jgi:hypothetical protein
MVWYKINHNNEVEHSASISHLQLGNRMSDWSNLLEETETVITKEVDKISLSVDSNKTAPAVPDVPTQPAAENKSEESAEDPG